MTGSAQATRCSPAWIAHVQKDCSCSAPRLPIFEWTRARLSVCHMFAVYVFRLTEGSSPSKLFSTRHNVIGTPFSARYDRGRTTCVIVFATDGGPQISIYTLSLRFAKICRPTPKLCVYSSDIPLFVSSNLGLDEAWSSSKKPQKPMTLLLP